MIPTALKDILVSTPDTLSGDVRFAGTRVPVRCLLDSLMHGRSIDGFLAGFPDVSREQALAVIRWQQDFSRSALGVEMADALAGAS